MSAQRQPLENKGGEGDFALYVHWPFCVSKCPYCDFNSHVAETVDQDAWARALVSELHHYGIETKGRRLDSVFFGGGTPSLMPARIVGLLLDEAARHWTFGPALEVTLEANPSSAESRKFKDFRAAGVNRVSVGIQSFDDAALRFLGRAHDAREARQAITLAERSFPRFSFDLIYALPGQSEADWRRALADALALAGDHLSLYQLTIERGTPFFAAHREGAFAIPGEDLASGLYEITQEVMQINGFPAYEISNHARPGGECRHNLVYWQGGDYVGIGPGAHGRVPLAGRRHATEQIPAPGHWLAAVGTRGHATRKSAIVSETERIEEYLMTGLRLAAGIDRARFGRLTGVPLAEAVESARLEKLVREGYMTADSTGIRATGEGMTRLNAVIAYLIG
jgi:putative oxygen-independent coproporphyrinogen III oxidase